MAALLTWGGKVLGVFLTALYLMLAIGLGSGPGITPQSVSLYLALGGFVLGLFRPLPGGLIALASISAFYLLDFRGYGRWPEGWVFPMFWLAGALLVLGPMLRTRRA